MAESDLDEVVRKLLDRVESLTAAIDQLASEVRALAPSGRNRRDMLAANIFTTLAPTIVDMGGYGCAGVATRSVRMANEFLEAIDAFEANARRSSRTTRSSEKRAVPSA